MLLFWDLHINSRVCDRVIQSMRQRIDQNPNEKNLVFLWDYVYHFSYDREALLALYTLFLDLYSQWKNVYILSWNHDWLWNTFVFEEAKRTYEIIKKINNTDFTWKIEFITQPRIAEIEGKNILFLPYFLLDSNENLNFDDYNVDSPISESKVWISSQWHLLEIENTINLLKNSKNKNERFSACVNKILLNNYKKYWNLVVMHHYYTEWVNFPWQKWRFYFNDVSLSHLFCELDGLKLISWHLHQWFAYKNYFCVWSVRNTSPLEINQAKMLFKYNDENMEWKMWFVNPYFQLENLEKDSLIDENFLKNFEKKIIQDNINNYMNQSRNVQIQTEYELKNKDISVLLKVDDINYDDMYSYIDESVFKNLKDVKLKKNFAKTEDVFEKMDVEWKNLTSGFSDRKWLLKQYLTTKYPDEYDKYLEFLKWENIL